MAWSGLKWVGVTWSGLEWVGAQFDKVPLKQFFFFFLDALMFPSVSLKNVSLQKVSKTKIFSSFNLLILFFIQSYQ